MNAYKKKTQIPILIIFYIFFFLLFHRMRFNSLIIKIRNVVWLITYFALVNIYTIVLFDKEEKYFYLRYLIELIVA